MSDLPPVDSQSNWSQAKRIRRAIYLLCLFVGLSAGTALGYRLGYGSWSGPPAKEVSAEAKEPPPGQLPHIIDPMTSMAVPGMAMFILFASVLGFIFVFVRTMDIVEREYRAQAGHRSIIVSVLMSGAPIRSITVSVIVLAVGFLAFLDKVDAGGYQDIIGGRRVHAGPVARDAGAARTHIAGFSSAAPPSISRRWL